MVYRRRRRRTWRGKRRFTRRFGRRRFTTKRRRTWRRRRSTGSANGVLKFRCREPETSGAQIFIDTITTTNSYVQFKLDSFPQTNLGQFKDMYQQVRCTRVAIRIEPLVKTLMIQSVPNFVMNVGSTAPPDMYAAIDYETDTGGISVANMTASQGCRRITAVGRGYTFRFCPATAAMSEEGGVTTAYMPKFKQWFDTNDTPTYRGIKFFVSNWGGMPAGIQPMGWRITRDTWWEFKRLRFHGVQ